MNFAERRRGKQTRIGTAEKLGHKPKRVAALATKTTARAHPEGSGMLEADRDRRADGFEQMPASSRDSVLPAPQSSFTFDLRTP